MRAVVFSLAAERYGIETARVLEVVAPGALTPVPGTPAFYRGLMNHRGRALPVLDLGRLLEAPEAGEAEARAIVVVEAGAGTVFGILARELAGISAIAAGEIAPPPAADPRAGFVKGVTRDMVAVLDVEALGRDPRIVVDAEVG